MGEKSKIEKPETKEEEMKEKEEKEISAAEKEKMPTIFMIYRDNDLFKEWVPKIAETLKGLGRRVEIQSFPAGTSEAEIDKWIEENKDEIYNSDIVTDGTVESEFYSTMRGEKIEENLKQLKQPEHLGSLDKLLDRATQRIVLGKEESEIKFWSGLRDYRDREVVDLESFKEAYSRIVKQILKNKENMPIKVYILQEKIKDHVPFREDEIVGDKRATAEILQKWLVEGGIPEEIIECTEHKAEDKKGNWIIKDRHNREWSTYYGIELRLPLESFYYDTTTKGLIKIEAEELENELREMLEEDFGKKPEEEK